MSFVTTQPITTMAEINLYAENAETVEFEQPTVDSALPDHCQGALKTPSKPYTFTYNSFSPTDSKANVKEYLKSFGPKNSLMIQSTKTLQSPMRLATATYTLSPQPTIKGEGKTEAQVLPRSFEAKSQVRGETKAQPNLQSKASSLPRAASAHRSQTSAMRPSENRQMHSQKHSLKQEAHSPLASRQWEKQETKKWWETRYHQKEREGDQKGRDRQDQQEHEEKEEFRVAKTAGLSSNKSTHDPSSGREAKPFLESPKLGVFALYYILTKMGVLSDGTSNFAYRKEIELVDLETSEAHKKRLDEMKEAIKKDQESARWGTAVKVFSWIGSLLGLLTGVILIATGVGAVAGAMLVAGSIIQITNQILELSGGWRKIAEILPGDDPEKKRAVLSWMQIGIAVLCLILSAVGTIWGGIAQFGQAMQTASNLIGGVALIGGGVTTIGEGINTFMYNNKLAEVKRYDITLARLKHKRQDLMENVEWGVERLEQLLEDLARYFDFEVQLFRADQMLYR